MNSIALRSCCWLVAVTILAGCADRDEPAADRHVWFEDLQGPIELGGAEVQSLVHYLRASLHEKALAPAAFPNVLQADMAPRIVFVSVSDGESAGHTAVGVGNGLLKAMEDAVAGIRLQPEAEDEPLWLKLDIVQGVSSDDELGFSQSLRLERSLHGLAFDRQSGLAFLAEELVAHTLVGSRQRIRPQNITKLLGSRSPQARRRFEKVTRSNRARVYRFTTTSVFSDGRQTFPLYRGHRLVRDVAVDDLLASARRAGDYLVRAVGPDGRFDYEYLPKTDKLARRYNILRHAGSIYSMLELYEVTREERLMSAARRAIDSLIASIERSGDQQAEFACVIEEGHVKLGGNALAMLALAKYTEITGDRRHVPIMVLLGRWMQLVQGDDGAFRIHKMTYPGRTDTGFISLYYPGEAIFALARLSRLDDSEAWLDAAERAAHQLINAQGGRPISQVIHDHWLVYGLNELYRLRPDPDYLDHAMRITDAIIAGQVREPAFPDWLGALHPSLRSTPTAIRSEALSVACGLARHAGRDDQTCGRILEALRLGVGFQLQTQFWPESAMYVRDPQRVMGGFRKSLTDFSVRIDYVQHSLSSILGLYRISLRQADPLPAIGPGAVRDAGEQAEQP